MPFVLGMSQFVAVEPDIRVVNMIAQVGTRTVGNLVPLRYKALEFCLRHVFEAASNVDGTVHMPRIGCGLAGGKWDEIENIINRVNIPFGADVFVYDLSK